MRQLAALAWKEWHEVRWMLVVALGVFLGLPLVGGLEAVLVGQRFAILTSPFVYYLDGLFAVFVAVDITCRDLGGRVEDFWRSRPIRPVAALLVKYLVGLLAVELACIAPLLVEAIIGEHPHIPYTAARSSHGARSSGQRFTASPSSADACCGAWRTRPCSGWRCCYCSISFRWCCPHSNGSASIGSWK